ATFSGSMLTAIEGGLRVDRLFGEALEHASPGFALGSRLAEMFPELAMVEGESTLFDVNAFARDGKCSIEPRADLYHQFDTVWVPDFGLLRRPRIAWLDVTWDGTSLQTILLSWDGRYSREDRFYVLARTRDTCNAFVEAVSRWNHDVRGEILVYNEGC